MNDKAAEIERQRRVVNLKANTPNLTAESFDENGYLWRYPDVAAGIAEGRFTSAFEHYLKYGHLEGCIPALIGENVGSKFAAHHQQSLFTPEFDQQLRQDCDGLLISEGGGVLLVGWVDDLRAPIYHVQIVGKNWTISIEGVQLLRSRRVDVEQMLSITTSHQYGYIGLLFLEHVIPPCGTARVIVTLRNGVSTEVVTAPSRISDFAFRETILQMLSNLPFYGNPVAELIAQLGGGIGLELLKLNRAVTRDITSSPFVQRFGRKNRRKKGSLIVCLHGKAEFVFLQNALFSRGEGIEDYEIIYVSNSPELAEVLMRDVGSCAAIYGIEQTLVLLSANAGFGAANNAAAHTMCSDRLVVINPDVFPREFSWARKHTELIEQVDSTVKLFGAPLYYDNGSLMHGGMFFDFDIGVAVRSGRIERQEMVRVEHYGKGAPESSLEFVRPRAVPAVTGAFISCERSWFEKLGGFSEDYILGHYEDADLCLKSFVSGIPPWLQNLQLWHLEGKGSMRTAVHEGASVVNRWLFHSRWAKTIANGITGPDPQHPAFSANSRPALRPREPGRRDNLSNE